MTDDQLVAIRAELEALKSRVSDIEARLSPSLPVPSDKFEKFWESYPRKVNKNIALRVFNKMPAKLQNEVLAAVTKFAAIWAQAPEDRKQFIPYPSTWLNSQGYALTENEWRRSAGVRIPKPMPGQHASPPPPVLDDNAPDWVFEVDRVLIHPLRPEIPDDILDMYFRWKCNTQYSEPTLWRERLAAAIREAQQFDRR